MDGLASALDNISSTVLDLIRDIAADRTGSIDTCDSIVPGK